MAVDSAIILAKSLNTVPLKVSAQSMVWNNASLSQSKMINVLALMIFDGELIFNGQPEVVKRMLKLLS